MTKILYAVGESSASDGSVNAFLIDRTTGKLTLLNRQSSGDAGPCYVSVDRTGKCVLVANYGGGSCAALPVRNDGSLGEASSFIRHAGSGADQARQARPHAHSINPSPDNRFALAADLGLDKILVYKLDPAKAALAPNDPPFAKVAPGSGPRHLAFHPAGKFAYVINEMLCTVTAFSYEPGQGVLREIQNVSTLPGGKSVKPGYSTAEVQVHPNGKFLYGSNRGHDTIAVFAIDQAKGTLELIGNEPTQGKMPRNFGLDPAGAWLLAANQDSNNVVVFSVDPGTGKLKPTGQVVEIGSPVCVKFMSAEALPAGKGK